MSGLVRRARWGKRTLRLLAAGAVVGWPLVAAAGELRVTVDGLPSARGMVLIGLYDNPRTFVRAVEEADKPGFLVDPQRFGAVALRANPARKAGVVFTHLRPGRYAVIVLHDENGNGGLDRNLLGVPVEAYGFSNGAEGFLGPPSFAAAAVTLGPGDHAVHIQLSPP